MTSLQILNIGDIGQTAVGVFIPSHDEESAWRSKRGRVVDAHFEHNEKRLARMQARQPRK